MNSDEENAKQLFFDYACSHYYMFHDGVEEEFKKYNISEIQEQEWRREFIDSWIGKLSVDDPYPLKRLRDTSAQEAISALRNLGFQGDSYSKLWCANAILDFIKGSESWAKQGNDAAIELFDKLATENIVISKEHRTKITLVMMLSLGTFTPEAFIRKYAANKLSDLERKNEY